MSGPDRFVTRRDLLRLGGMGIGGLALSGVMRDSFGGETRPAAVHIESPLTPRQPHFAPTAPSNNSATVMKDTANVCPTTCGW